jgi:hypothetical protein
MRAWLTKSLKLTENTACFSAARKKLFREMATLAARMFYDDLAHVLILKMITTKTNAAIKSGI